MARFSAPTGTTSQRGALTLEVGEIVYDTDLDALYVGDGATLGGNVLAGGGGGAWGSITGTLSDQTDLQAALDAKADSSHTHAASDITSGTFNDARIAESNVTQHEAALTITESQISDLGAYITASSVDVLTNKSGSNSQWTNDEGYLTSAPVDSVNGLTGVVLLDTDDISEGTNLYFTNERAQDAVGTILVDSSEIDFTYNDGTPSITAAIVMASIDETKLDASVNASLDLADSALQAGDNISVLTNDAGYITATLTNEQVEDIVGGMVTGNTETLITVTYQDADGTLDFVVDADLGNYTNSEGWTANTGTVTSVAVSGSDGIEVDSGSPITASGTIALGINAVSLRSHINVADGAEVNAVDSVNALTGAIVLDADDIDDTATTNKFVTASDLTTLSNTSGTNTGDQDLSGLVPYTGATTNLNLGANNLVLSGTVDGRDVSTDGTKLDGIETGADVTDEANVTDALDGATLTDVGTPAAGDLILLQDASDSNILKVAQFSEFGGEGGSSPLTTKGDIYTYSTTDARLPVGTNGQVLLADSAETTGLKWGSVFATANVDTFRDGVDYTSGTSTSLTLSSAPDSENATQVFFDGVYQQKTEYSLSGTTLTFSTAIPLGVSSVEVNYGVTASSNIVNTINSDPTGVTGADQVANVMSLTQAEYDAITPNASTFYIITDA